MLKLQGWRRETTLSEYRFYLKPGSGIRLSREEINRTKKKKGKKGKRIKVWVLGHRDAKIPGTLEILASEAA